MKATLFDVWPKFDGPVFDPALDQARLTRQLGRVFDLMRDGHWRTLQEIADATGDPQASVSAQLRHLRKRRFGGYRVDKRRRGLPERGAWEYRVVVEDRADRGPVSGDDDQCASVIRLGGSDSYEQ